MRAIAVYERSEKLARSGDLFIKSVAVVRDDRTFIITSAYHEDRFVTESVDVTVSLPRKSVKLGDPPRVSQTALWSSLN